MGMITTKAFCEPHLSNVCLIRYDTILGKKKYKLLLVSVKQITEEFFYKALFIFWEAPKWQDATAFSYCVLSENSGRKNYKEDQKKTNLFHSWKLFTELFQNTFCAIVLALCCAIPKHCWCKCSSCGWNCITADRLYASPGYERKVCWQCCLGSTSLSVCTRNFCKQLCQSEPANVEGMGMGWQ